MDRYSKRLITINEAMGRSSDPEELRNMMVNAGVIKHTTMPR
jgi:hypothetical protein